VPSPSHWPQRPLHQALLLVGGIGGGFVLGILIGDAYVGRSTWSLLRIDPDRFTGILLGSLGVHNFYLGYIGKGVAQLLITVLSCGWLWIVSWIWGLIEGIMILSGSTKTDANGVPLRD
jgi:TM2 domain-containing membrane protein YozV